VHAHRLRAENDAILVGINTVLNDDPQLTTRLAKGRNPIRILLDSRFRVPIGANILKQGNAVVFTTAKSASRFSKKAQKIISQGCNIVTLSGNMAVEGRLSLAAVLKKLPSLGVSTLLVEGGGKTISAFIKQKLADELILFITPWLIGEGGIPFVDFKSAKKLGKSLKLNSLSCTTVGDDVLLRALFR